MRRRRFIIRRFGAMTFGLGYFEEGAWVDHTAAASGAVEEDPILANVHDALGCCIERKADVRRGAAMIVTNVDIADVMVGRASSRLTP